MSSKKKTLMRNRPARRPLNEPMIQQHLTPLVQALLDPDDVCRQKVVAHVQQNCIPAVITRLMRRLVDLLGSGHEDARPQAMASLIQFGDKAVPALIHEFTLARHAALQQDVIQVLLQIAPRLDQDQRCDLMTDMVMLGRFAADDSVVLGFRKLVAVLRLANDNAAEKAPQQSTAGSA
jgi:HEAT repeat protein